MWFEERSWSSMNQMKMSSLIVEEWRDIWSFKIEFMLVGLAYLFATTNFLNLPRLVLENGVAFLAAYGAALLVVILPILILELSVGQLTGRAPIQALYNICPVFKGVGVSQIVFSLFVMAYMTRYMAWLFLYLFHLFWTIIDDRPGLPWLNCKNFPELQTAGLACREPTNAFAATVVPPPPVSFNPEVITANASTALLTSLSYGQQLSTLHQESALSHFMRTLENPSESIAEIGQFQIYFLIAQAAVWVIVSLAICFGVRVGQSGHVHVHWTFCDVVGVAGRCLFLGGAVEMYQQFFYDTTDWQKLYDYMVWKTAIEQAILATGIGFGAWITIASYNKRSNNLVRDSFLLLLGHVTITILQMSTVVSLVGFLNLRTGLSPLELINQGEIQMWQILVYLSFIPHTKIFTGLLLFMCIFVLLNIFYLLSLSVLATLEDGLGERWSRCCPRFILALFVCLLGAGTSVYFATQAGKHAYELASGYLKYITLCTILAFELLAVSWFYCAHSLGKDLRTMLHSSCCWCLGHFLLFLTYLLPAIPSGIAVVNVMTYSYAKYSPAVQKWEFSEYLGAAIALVPLLPIPLFSLAAICRSCNYPSNASKFQRFRHAFRSPMRHELMKGCSSLSASHRGSHPPASSADHLISPRGYSSSAPGYVLLPQAPLAEPEGYIDGNPVLGPTTVSTTTTATSQDESRGRRSAGNGGVPV
uniref:Sodium:neurotransmitter symporter family protein n=1 Tax=Ditylenchus dipsaci TaxID=166011 RepID=A0A915EH73_9BILA